MKILSNQLSDGEQRKGMIARMLEIKKALVKKPALILADEPVGGLDPKYGLQIMRILQGLNNDGHTIVMVTHETYASKHAKRIIKMLNGRVKSDFIVKNRRLVDDRRDVVLQRLQLDCLSNKAIPLNTEFPC